MQQESIAQNDGQVLADWAARVAWRSTGIVVVAGKLQCEYWKVLRHYNAGVTIVLFDPDRSDDFAAEKRLDIVGCSTLHTLSQVVASRYKVPWRVEVIGSDDVRLRFGDAISGAVDRAVRGVVEAEHTTRVNAEPWLKLGLRTLVEMAGKPCLNGISQTTLAGKTAVIVGAGPSLDKNVKVLAEHQDKVVIFACDAAIKPLHKAGVQPHVIVTVEAKGVPTKPTLQNPIWKEAIAIPGVHVSDLVWKIKPLRWLWGVQLVGPIGPCVVETLGLPLMRSGGSVSTVAYSAAQLMGAERIVLVGMDSAMSSTGKYYGKNVAFPHLREETILTKCVAYGGIGYVDAPRQLCSYREWFEARAHEARAAGRPVVNATEGGARIDGTTERRLVEAIGDELPLGDGFKEHLLAAVDDAPLVDVGKLIPVLRDEQVKAVAAADKAQRAARAMGDAYAYIDEMLTLPKANILFRSAVGPIQESGMMPRGNEIQAGQRILARVADKQTKLDTMLCDTIKALEGKRD